MVKKSERTDGCESKALCKKLKQTMKDIIASINEQASMHSQSDSDTCNTSTIQFADKSPLKTPFSCSINQIEILQNLENYTFAAQFEDDDFLQEDIVLLKKPVASTVNVLPTPWRKKIRCFSLDSNEFLYMDERLVTPKLLGPIILRILHYGQPGRDSMLATVANVWWP